MIFQDFVRFHLRARDNVSLGRVDAIDDLDEIREAARHANADEFLSSLPEATRPYSGLNSKAGQICPSDSGNA